MQVSIFNSEKPHQGYSITREILDKILNLPRMNPERERRWVASRAGSSPIDSLLNSFTRFVADARRMDDQGDSDQGFLYRVVALDMLLGEKGENTKSFVRRAAALSARLRGNQHQEELKRMKRLWDARSLFVHKGRRVSDEDQKVCRDFCAAVFWYLWEEFRSSIDTNQEGKLAVDAWWKRLDAIAACQLADLEPSAEMWASIGLQGETEPCLKDNRGKREPTQ